MLLKKCQTRIVWFVWFLAIAGSSATVVADQKAPVPEPVGDPPPGHYTLDKTHATINFTVSHLGFSSYTGSFSRFDATLDFDPARLATAKLTATVDLASLGIPAPPDGFLATLLGPDWLNADEFPQLTYRSTAVTPTGDDSARVVGELTLNGKTAPVTLTVTFNGGYAGVPGFDPNARAGFSAQGSFNRSEFGITAALPAPGSTMGVGDEVSFTIEAEFSGPPLATPGTGP